MLDDSTICAISTAPGNAAIAVLRLSGPDAINIADTIFISPKEGTRLMDQNSHTVHFGRIEYQDEVIDEVLVSVFINPHSYTGENLVELSCHGSPYIQQQIIKILINKGARFATPGEFTMRAFLNKKMDLSQAEAVADLIASESHAAQQMAINQMRGEFSRRISGLRKQLVDISSLIELELDFSEEDVEFANRYDLIKIIEGIKYLLVNLIKSFDYGNVIKNGVPVAIVGKPNVGKSTLLNTLLNDDKAIVSEIAGTTRDAIEDQIQIEGIRFRFIDTAGIRETTDKIETLGIERTFDKINKARIILLITEDNQTPVEIGKQITEINPSQDQKLIVIVNKIDIADEKQVRDKFGGNKGFAPYPTLFLSAKKQIHMDELIKVLLESIKTYHESDVIVSNIRHYFALKHSEEAAGRVLEGLRNGLTTDFISIDIRTVMHYLGEITGDITNDEILANIFSRFCIGK
jgi:tRNA modification GTPase